MYATTTARSTFSLGIHIPALSDSCVPFNFGLVLHTVFGYSMTNHHYTFLTGFGLLLTRHTCFFAFRPLSSFASNLLCHRIQPLQQRSIFLIVQCHSGFWLSTLQRNRAWPLLVDLSHSTNFNTLSVHTAKVTPIDR